MRRLLSLALVIVLLGANPSVTTEGVTTSTSSSGISSVTLGANPTAGQQFVLIVFEGTSATAPSLSGTWSGPVCSSTGAGNSSEWVYNRTVVSGDTSSSTVTVLSTAISYSGLALYEVANFNAFEGSTCNVQFSTSASPTLTMSQSASNANDLGIGAAYSYDPGSSAQHGAPSFSQCSGYSTDGTPTGYFSYTYWGAMSGSKALLPSGSQTCQIAITTQGTSQKSYGVLALISGVSSSWQPFGIWRVMLSFLASLTAQHL